jgi:hypothetical protein
MVAFRIFITATAFMLATTNAATAGEFRAEAVAAIDGKVECSSQKNVTTVGGPCDTFAPPATVTVGETFMAEGETRKIGVILAYQADEDVTEYAMNIKKGEWTCIAAETLDDIPSEEKREQRQRTWLYIHKCKPVRLLGVSQ